MTADEIKAAVMTALPLRPPHWTPENRVPPQEKVAALEDYLLLSAYQQAELEEALFYIENVLTQLKVKVEQMTGYEPALPPKRSERITQADIQTAKQMTDPITFELGAEMKQLRATALRQIDRFRFEAQWIASRAYSMISGG